MSKYFWCPLNITFKGAPDHDFTTRRHYECTELHLHAPRLSTRNQGLKKGVMNYGRSCNSLKFCSLSSTNLAGIFVWKRKLGRPGRRWQGIIFLVWKSAFAKLITPTYVTLHGHKCWPFILRNEHDINKRLNQKWFVPIRSISCKIE